MELVFLSPARLDPAFILFGINSQVKSPRGMNEFVSKRQLVYLLFLGCSVQIAFGGRVFCARTRQAARARKLAVSLNPVGVLQ